MIVTDFMEDLTKDIVVTDEEIKKYYDEQLKISRKIRKKLRMPKYN